MQILSSQNIFAIVFDHKFYPIFRLIVDKDAVFEPSVWGYDRYEPRLGARFSHGYIELGQDLKSSITF